MSDASASSWQQRALALPFAAWLGLGGLTGFVLAGLGALTVDTADQEAKAAPSGSVGAESPEEAAVAGAGSDPAGGAGGPGAAAEDAPAGGSGAARNGAAAGDAEADDGDAAADAQPSDEPAEGPDPDGSASGDPEAEVEVVEDEPDTAALDVGGGTPPAPAAEPSSAGNAAVSPPPSDRDREAEAQASADELYSMAKDAYEAGEYKDAYRLATRSQRARPADKTQMLRGRAACRIKDEKNAKEVVKSFKLGDERRKELRTFCKERGVRVGL